MKVSRSLPVYLDGCALPKPAITEYNIEGCLRKRLYHATPGFNHAMLKRLRHFTIRWCYDNLHPLTELTSFEEWIKHTNYSLRRKRELSDLRSQGSVEDVFNARVECHVKDESYEDYKFPRMISSREDKAKVWLGPIFHSIEQEVYKLPYFVKGLTEQQRIDKIIDVFGDRDVYVTDYSAFETHFIPKLIANCEMVVYRYMLHNFPEERRIIQVLFHQNRLRSRFFSGELEGVRMSGEMNTSLGNGLSNLILMHFMAQEMGFKILNCLVEGDDGLFEIHGTPPSPSDAERYGLELKIDKAKPSTASFCGCIFNPDTRTNFGHPLKHLVSFGWAGRRYLSLSTKKSLELVMSRVYSFCSLYPGVPLIWKLCQLCINHLPEVKYYRCLKYLDRYKSANLRLSSTVKSPSLSDRHFFGKLTGITEPMQYLIEADFERSFPIIRSPLLLEVLPDSWLEVFENYTE